MSNGENDEVVKSHLPLDEPEKSRTERRDAA